MSNTQGNNRCGTRPAGRIRDSRPRRLGDMSKPTSGLSSV